MTWIGHIESWIKMFATQVPLEVFVFVGALLEEIIAPIPSPLVMTTAGALALVEERTLIFILWLSLIASVGKTIGAWLFYVIGDKLEDVTLKRFGGWLGIRHEDVESIGKRFGKNHWKDGSVLFFLRAAPFFPSAVISFVSGVIKLNFQLYIGVSFIGNFVKNFIYAYSGFAGVTVLHRLWQDAERIRLGMDVFVVLGIVILAFVIYMNREVGLRYLARLIERLSRRPS